jgi:hypothetical protein
MNIFYLLFSSKSFCFFIIITFLINLSIVILKFCYSTRPLVSTIKGLNLIILKNYQSLVAHDIQLLHALVT